MVDMVRVMDGTLTRAKGKVKDGRATRARAKARDSVPKEDTKAHVTSATNGGTMLANAHRMKCNL